MTSPQLRLCRGRMLCEYVDDRCFQIHLGSGSAPGRLPWTLFTEFLLETGGERNTILFGGPSSDGSPYLTIGRMRELVQIESISECGIVGRLRRGALCLPHGTVDHHCVCSHTTHR